MFPKIMDKGRSRTDRTVSKRWIVVTRKMDLSGRSRQWSPG